jgi:hypothetical protein
MSGATAGLTRDVGEICAAVAIGMNGLPALWVAKPASALDVPLGVGTCVSMVRTLGRQAILSACVIIAAPAVASFVPSTSVVHS